MRLVVPATEFLCGYVEALERGWSPDNVRGDAARRDELTAITIDPRGFLRRCDDREALGPAIMLNDGTRVPRLPGIIRWMWDGEFCGTIGFRWQPGTEELPAYCPGHIGYGVVPWKRGRGYASRALREMLKEAKAEGLRYVEITTDPDNIGSQRVILANGGVFVEEFTKMTALGGGRGYRYRVSTDLVD